MDVNLDSLLGGSSDDKSLLDPAALLAPLMPFIILITIASLLIGILYIISIVTTYRSHKATIEMRDIMREMNERDKARSSSAEKQSASNYDTDDAGTASSSSIRKS